MIPAPAFRGLVVQFGLSYTLQWPLIDGWRACGCPSSFSFVWMLLLGFTFFRNHVTGCLWMMLSHASSRGLYVDNAAFWAIETFSHFFLTICL